MNIHKNTALRFIIPLISLFVSIGFIQSIAGYLFRGDVVDEHREALISEEKRNKELKIRLEEATSAAYIEKQAREKLGLARQGDTIILMDKSQISSPNDQTKQREQFSNWKRWWKLFF